MRVDDDLEVVASCQQGVFTRAQAVAAGATPAVVRHRLATGRWRMVHRGVYRLAGAPPGWHQDMFAAWLAAGAGAVVSHAAAARCWEIPGAPVGLDVSVPVSRRPTLVGVRVHRQHVVSADRARKADMDVTTPARTLVDLSAVLSDEDLAVALDHCLSHRLTSLSWLRRCLDRLGRGRAGTSRLAAALNDRPSQRRLPESRFERRLLALLATLPGLAPVPQYEVALPGGRTARLDIAYPAEAIGVEADSYVHHSSATDWAADHTRRRLLVAIGWRILPVTWEDLEHRPHQVLQLVQTARGAEVCTAGVVEQHQRYIPPGNYRSA
ncbi:MAG: type IV toxin-antitoxin system AbiEi family antitoxin domain-containing protein [Acidimicrobiales bacterium]